MKSTLCFAAMSLLLLGSYGPAQADHRRQLDDSAFAVLGDARDIRWHVRDHLTHSGSLRYLCRESDDIFATARNLQDVIFLGRTLPIICRNIEKVQTELCEFEDVLNRSDVARHTSHRLHHRSRGGSFVGIGVHEGHGPVLTLQERIQQMKLTLDAMHAMASGQPLAVEPPLPQYVIPPQGYPIPPHGNTPRQYQVEPPQPTVPNRPGRTSPPDRHESGPHLPGPMSRHHHSPDVDRSARQQISERAVSLPLGKTGIVLRFNR